MGRVYFHCPACGELRDPDRMLMGELLPAAVARLVQQQHSGWTPLEPVCHVCVNQARAAYVQGWLPDKGQPLAPDEQQVMDSIRNQELVSLPMVDAWERDQTRAERAAQMLIGIIGSWRFSWTILVLLVGWVSVNVAQRPFEPYPVIILAAISAALGSLAALQGPIILMAQRQQAQRDRLRAHNDYQVNLKAELEIQYLHEKIDRLARLLQDIRED